MENVHLSLFLGDVLPTVWSGSFFIFYYYSHTSKWLHLPPPFTNLVTLQWMYLPRLLASPCLCSISLLRFILCPFRLFLFQEVSFLTWWSFKNNQRFWFLFQLTFFLPLALSLSYIHSLTCPPPHSPTSSTASLLCLFLLHSFVLLLCSSSIFSPPRIPPHPLCPAPSTPLHPPRFSCSMFVITPSPSHPLSHFVFSLLSSSLSENVLYLH